MLERILQLVKDLKEIVLGLEGAAREAANRLLDTEQVKDVTRIFGNLLNRYSSAIEKFEAIEKDVKKTLKNKDTCKNPVAPREA